MRKLLKELIRMPIQKMVVPALKRIEQWAEKDLPQFGNTPKNLTIFLPRTICAPERIFIGDDVWLGPGSLLIPVSVYPTSAMLPRDRPRPFHQKFDPKIVIGNRVTATANLTLAAHQEIVIEDDVLFASNVNITDGLHGYENADDPYKYQPIFRIAPIIIKRGCWIGQNVVVMPGVTIGELSIIGANSVVTKSIPNRCIAVGSPARIIKKWDAAFQKWLPVADEPASDRPSDTSDRLTRLSPHSARDRK